MTKADARVGHLKRRPKPIGTRPATGAVYDDLGSSPGEQVPDRSQLEQIIAGLTEGVI
jgi:hypothetical protein